MSRKKTSINVKLLIDTLSIQSASNNDTNMLSYIKKIVGNNGLTCSSDTYGNLYVTKGSGPYVCFVSHVDTVHALIKDYRVYKHDDVLFAFNGTTGKQYGVGGKYHCHNV